LKINYTSVLSIIIISSLLGLLINYINPKGIPFIKEDRQLKFVDDSTASYITNEIIETDNNKNPNEIFDEAKAITLKQAYSLFNQNVLFIDARDYVEYEIGHIKNAVSLPYVDFDEYKNILDTIPKSIPIVAYCDGRDCDLSILLGDKLFETGYKEVYIFFGGWVDWQMANFPVDGEDE
jgi:rhodanese-related sulfurtransferase